MGTLNAIQVEADEAHRGAQMAQPQAPEHLEHAHGEVPGDGHDQEGDHRPGDQLPVGRALHLDLPGDAARAPAP